MPLIPTLILTGTAAGVLHWLFCSFWHMGDPQMSQVPQAQPKPPGKLRRWVDTAKMYGAMLAAALMGKAG